MTSKPNTHSSLEQWLTWLESLHSQSIDLGLERVAKVAAQLPFDLSDRRVITIAGTNGKGSCVAALEALLLSIGRTVGAYTSPHLLRYNERVRLNGDEVDDESLIHSFALVEAARGDTALTYFEFGTLAAMALMMAAGVDDWVLEVGLGGRLDAVNIIDPSLAIITSIDLDHQDWLGNDRESIGAEKAGIMRRDTPVICADLNPPASVLRQAERLSAPLLLAGKDFGWQQQSDCWRWWGSDVSGPHREHRFARKPQLAEASVAAALQAFLYLGYPLQVAEVEQVLDSCRLAGRRQRLPVAGCEIIVDVAHNPAAVEYLLANISLKAETAVIFAAMADKDLLNMFRPLVRAGVRHWHLCELPEVPRAASGPVMQQQLRAAGGDGECYDSVAAALERARAQPKCEQILVLGSFYTAAAMLEHLKMLGNESE